MYGSGEASIGMPMAKIQEVGEILFSRASSLKGGWRELLLAETGNT